VVTAPVVLQPGVYQLLIDCPLVPRGHTMLLNCGKNFLNLDESFAAMRIANSHLWNSLAKLGDLLQGKDGGSVQTFLHGTASYNAQVYTQRILNGVSFITSYPYLYP
jgi:hypothetical protein